MSETVVLQNLTIGYTVKGQQRVVARNLNAAIHSGELTCLLGQNGIGKSTLLRTLSAFQPALAGDILLTHSLNAIRNATLSKREPSSLNALTDKQLSRLVGVVLTEKPEVQNMTVTELVAMGRSPYTGLWGTLTDDDRHIVAEAIRLVGIEPLEHRMVHTLSDGERQKVMIAKALAQQTPVIYLDEPTAFLDFPSKVDMMQLLHRLATEQQKTIFLSTHDVELALQLADCIWLMENEELGIHNSTSQRSENNSSFNIQHSKLTVGTPGQLASQGLLNQFLERPGITFDPDNLTLRVSKI